MIKSKKIKKEVDLLIINNVPSFFKVNLYNELAQKCRIHVIFLAITDQAVIKDTLMNDIRFSFDLLSNVEIRQRNILWSFLKVYRICKSFDYRKLIFGGYVDLESLMIMFLMPKRNNCLQFESTVKESAVKGIKAAVKKIVFNRHACALPAGELHAEVFRTLGYKGRIILTHGVGLINKHELLSVRVGSKKADSQSGLRYLYVGRLIEVKNLELLIDVFNQTGKSLTIVGKGEMADQLIQKAKSHIKFHGFVSHQRIHEVYHDHDVLILPSKSETWGLVVEEAICAGLPVVVSDAVGCQLEMVAHPNTGLIFHSGDEQSLINAMVQMESFYETYRNHCLDVSFDLRDQMQVEAYLEVLEMSHDTARKIL